MIESFYEIDWFIFILKKHFGFEFIMVLHKKFILQGLFFNSNFMTVTLILMLFRFD